MNFCDIVFAHSTWCVGGASWEGQGQKQKTHPIQLLAFFFFKSFVASKYCKISEAASCLDALQWLHFSGQVAWWWQWWAMSPFYVLKKLLVVSIWNSCNRVSTQEHNLGDWKCGHSITGFSLYNGMFSQDYFNDSCRFKMLKLLLTFSDKDYIY